MGATISRQSDTRSDTPIRILAVSDQVVPTLFNKHVRENVGPIDLLLSCGDLPYSYLEYLVTTLNAPYAFYVHGNHDMPESREDNTLLTEPGGWVNLDKRSVYIKPLDLLIAGLEGSIRYHPRARYQYSQRQMTLRAQSLLPQFLQNRVLYGRTLDIFIAHSPVFGIHDGPDWPHTGFKVFIKLLERFRPRLFLHGHKHRYGPLPWRTRHTATDVVNVYPFRLIQWHQGQVLFGHGQCSSENKSKV